jgi:hypothetical protein
MRTMAPPRGRPSVVRWWRRVLVATALGAFTVAAAALPAGAATPQSTGPRTRMTAQQLQQLIGTSQQYELDHAVVTGDVSLTLLELIVSDVVFEGDVSLDPNDPQAVRPEARYVFTNTSFNGRVKLGQNLQVLSVQDCRFAKDLALAGGDIQSLQLIRSNFAGHAFVQRARVGLLDLEGSQFDQPAYFTATRIESAQFENVTADAPIQLELSQLGDTWLADQVKNARQPGQRVDETLGTLAFLEANLRATDHLAAATEVHYARVQIQRAGWSPQRRVLSYLPQVYNSYGTRPWQPVLLGLAMILVFAALFSWKQVFVEDADAKVIKPRTPALLHSLLFSADTFVPVISISGVRDWGWRVADPWRWLEVTERATGVALTALATVSLATYL